MKVPFGIPLGRHWNDCRKPVCGCATNAMLCRNLSHRDTAALHVGFQPCYLLVRQLRGRAELHAPLDGPCAASSDALGDQLALELGHAAENVEHQLAGGGRGVDASLIQHDEVGTLAVKLLGDLVQVED